MKIGILTIHNSPNYGACLQSYALFKYLQDQGHDVEIIDLHRPYQKDYVKSSVYVPYKKGKREFSFFRACKSLLNLHCSSKEIKYLSDESAIRFEDFNRAIQLSKPYCSIDELYANPPEYDVYITGSDQVWNPFQPYCVEPFFLTFAPKGKKRISYAASLGVDSVPDDLVPMYKKWLSLYDFVSVRETETKNYLEAISGVPIRTVADPTFLLDIKTWKEIAIYPQKHKPYILLFTLGYNKDLLNFCQRLSTESGLVLVNFRSIQAEYKEGCGYEAVTDGGPRDFLGYMGNAELVITNSFHGSVFAFLMGAKNVYTYVAPGFQRGVRMRELYRVLGCESHLIHKLDYSYDQLKNNPLDEAKIDKCIQDYSIASRQILKDFIK